MKQKMRRGVSKKEIKCQLIDDNVKVDNLDLMLDKMEGIVLRKGFGQSQRRVL